MYSFVKEGYLVNLACIDPRQLATWRVSTSSKSVGLTLTTLDVKDTHYALCVSIVHITDCHLLSPHCSYVSDGSGIQFLEGNFLVQEFEHLIGCLGVVYEKSSFVFDLSSSHFQFRTYVEKRRDEDEDIGQGSLCFLPPTSPLILVNRAMLYVNVFYISFPCRVLECSCHACQIPLKIRDV